jgi:methionyl-tRNA formyltransferase
MRVLFWGTPEFATPPLRALIGEGFDVAAVVTQPDRPVGRSRSKLVASAVKAVAVEEGIEVLQPDRPRGDAFLADLGRLAPDISVVVAYGHILPRAVIDLPRLGTINIHASLLPRFRGAAPIQAAIRDGLTETGVTIMRMVPALDAGPVIHALATPIADDETGGELALRLSEMGALALIEALSLIDIGNIAETPQDDAAATYAPKIDRDATRVRWDATALDVSRAIRAYDPRPGAFAVHRGADVKLFGARRVTTSVAAAPGTVVDVDDLGVTIACGAHGEPRDAVVIAEVQPSGKRRLTAAAWHHGRGITLGERLS